MSGTEFHRLRCGKVTWTERGQDAAFFSDGDSVPFFCLKTDPVEGSDECVRHEGLPLLHHRVTDGEEIKIAEYTDCMPEEGALFLRFYRTLRDVSFTLSFSDDLSLRFFPSYAAGTRFVPVICAERNYPGAKKPFRMLFPLDSRMRWDPENRTLVLKRGSGCFVFSFGELDAASTSLSVGLRLASEGEGAVFSHFPAWKKQNERVEAFFNRHPDADADEINAIRFLSSELFAALREKTDYSREASSSGFSSDALLPAVCSLLLLDLPEEALALLRDTGNGIASLADGGEIALFLLASALALEKKRDGKLISLIEKELIGLCCRDLRHGEIGMGRTERCIRMRDLPPDAFSHGSSQATAAFIAAGKRLLSLKVLEEKTAKKLKNHVDCALAFFEENFRSDAGWILNDPRREKHIRHRRFLFGFCEKCSGEKTVEQWLERDRTGRYLCSDCLALSPLSLPAKKDKPLVTLRSVFSPFYPDFLPISFLFEEADEALSDKISPLIGENRFGLTADAADALLFFDRIGHPLAASVYRKLMNRRRPDGGWSEAFDAWGDPCGGIGGRLTEASVLCAFLYHMENRKTPD